MKKKKFILIPICVTLIIIFIISCTIIGTFYNQIESANLNAKNLIFGISLLGLLFVFIILGIGSTEM